jgi:hypothetical protein
VKQQQRGCIWVGMLMMAHKYFAAPRQRDNTARQQKRNINWLILF